MRIAIGSDKNGYTYKQRVGEYLREKGILIEDVGTHDDKYPVDYPIYGEKVGKLVAEGDADYGIVICATGIGIMIACNKIDGVRCGMGYNDDVSRLMRQHNDANVIAFGQNHMAIEDVLRRIDVFISTPFLGDYHCTRIDQIRDLERGLKIKQTPFFDVQ